MLMDLDKDFDVLIGKDSKTWNIPLANKDA
jgi:hypothetical protein